MKKFILSVFAMGSITAMAQSISVNTFTPVQTPQSSYDRIGHLNSIMGGQSNSNQMYQYYPTPQMYQYYSTPQMYRQYPTPAPQAQSTPKTQLRKGTYFDGRNWKIASVRLAEDRYGVYIYSTNSEGFWQRCNKSYLREISEYDDMSKYFNYSAKGGIYTFYF